MNKFFKAIEQAEQERVLREQARRAPRTPAAPPDNPSSTRVPVAAPPRREGVPLPDPELAFRRSVTQVEGVEEHLVSLLTPASFEAEQYRALGYLVEQMRKNADLHVLAVTSAVPGDGKTTTAINLAGALAQAPEARVLLVDTDLRRPSVADFLGLDTTGSRGLVDAILAPGLALKDAGRRRFPFNLSVLPAGRRTVAPFELLKSPRLGELLQEARQRYDYIVLDTPPLIPFPDCRLIEKWVDGFLVVVAANKTPRKQVQEALSAIDSAKIVGFVFNGDARSLSRYYSGYYDAAGRPRPKSPHRLSGGGAKKH